MLEVGKYYKVSKEEQRRRLWEAAEGWRVFQVVRDDPARKAVIVVVAAVEDARNQRSIGKPGPMYRDTEAVEVRKVQRSDGSIQWDEVTSVVTFPNGSRFHLDPGAAIVKSCTCSMAALMAGGCQCGAVAHTDEFAALNSVFGR